MAKATRNYYFLTSCLVMFTDKEGPNVTTIKTLPVNVMLINGTGTSIGVKEISKVQQGAQQKFWGKLGHEAIPLFNVVDVVIEAIMPLGFMTDAQFNNLDPAIVREVAENPDAEVTIQ